MPSRVAVVGAGSWGTTVAVLASQNAPTTLWARNEALAAGIAREHRNGAYLPDHRLPDALVATASLPDAVGGADVVVMAVPSHGFRGVLERVAPHLRDGAAVASVAKGLEPGTGRRMSEIVREVLPRHPAAVLTGPTLAAEVLAGRPAASVVAAEDPAVATALRDVLSTAVFRVYTNTDVVGCELGGALKNVIALAAGMADGLDLGDNARAALITRGLAEMTRLGAALGGDPLTFSGLAGVGDLVVTCMSRRSRNRHVGEQLARGRTTAEVLAGMQMVAEGVRTCPVAASLAEAHGVEMPIVEQVVAVVHHGLPAADALWNLLQRRARPELHGLAG